MKHITVLVDNLTRLLSAYESLAAAGYKLPKIGLVHGFAGAGKTTGISYLNDRVGACYVRATAAWTPSSMLMSILRELGRDDLRNTNSQARLEEIVRALSIANRPLFIDEADYLFDDRPRTLGLLRDIHDLAGVPLILIGMERISRKIGSLELLASRVSQEVKFLPLDLADARRVVEATCDVVLAPDLIEDLHEAAGGSIRRITVGIAQVESYAQLQGWGEIDLAAWRRSNRPYFLKK